ncbi:hypothetical protein FRC12_023467 [Ceratobasidium sp. 428]|nr:hypothetical protein FRC12_023467 [Ceratobasidium sp. 428]
MSAHDPTIIPLDIILHIVKYAAPSEAALLLQLNRICYHTILPTLYRSVSLRALWSLIAFCNAIINGDHLRDHVYTLDIQLDPNQDIDWNFPCLLRPMLELVASLTDLTLTIPPRMAWSVFSFSNFPYPFTLKRLLVSPIRDIVEINRFLHFQHRIEIFGLAYESWSSQFKMDDLILDSNFHNSGLLPYLRQAIVPWPLLPGLMPRRSVTHVDISSLPLEPENMIELGQLLWEAIVPLEYLKLGLVVPSTGPVEPALNHIILLISPCRRLLKELSIRLWSRVSL